MSEFNFFSDKYIDGRNIEYAQLTYTGRLVWVLDPRPWDFHLDDVARGISRENRFNGQGAYPYSVAAHSIALAKVVPNHLKLVALVHDIPESLMKDLPRPIKVHESFGFYRDIEDRLFSVMCQGLGIPFSTLPEEFHHYDRLMGSAECLAFMTNGLEYLRFKGRSEEWIDSAREWTKYVVPIPPEQGEIEWKNMFNGLMNEPAYRPD